jgi:hypothetical protein
MSGISTKFKFVGFVIKFFIILAKHSRDINHLG